MGNCATCLSRELVHHCNDDEEEEESMMVRVLRTTDNELFEFPGPVFVKDLLFGFQGFAVFHTHKTHNSSHVSTEKLPLHPDTQLQSPHIYYLKPWVRPSPLVTTDFKPLVKQPMVSPLQDSSAAINTAENMNTAHAVQREEAINSAQSPSIQSPTKEKVVKKVRFAEELLVQTPSSNKPVNPNAAAVSEYLPTTRKQAEAHHSFSLKKDLRPQREEDLSPSLKEGAVPYIVNKEVVRLKVVISKKELTELMSSRLSGKQAGDALMEKMLASLVPPTTSPNLAKSIKSSQFWRPSLDHIPEGHSSPEVF